MNVMTVKAMNDAAQAQQDSQDHDQHGQFGSSERVVGIDAAEQLEGWPETLVERTQHESERDPVDVSPTTWHT